MTVQSTPKKIHDQPLYIIDTPPASPVTNAEPDDQRRINAYIDPIIHPEINIAPEPNPHYLIHEHYPSPPYSFATIQYSPANDSNCSWRLWQPPTITREVNSSPETTPLKSVYYPPAYFQKRGPSQPPVVCEQCRREIVCRRLVFDGSFTEQTSAAEYNGSTWIYTSEEEEADWQ